MWLCVILKVIHAGTSKIALICSQIQAQEYSLRQKVAHPGIGVLITHCVISPGAGVFVQTCVLYFRPHCWYGWSCYRKHCWCCDSCQVCWHWPLFWWSHPYENLTCKCSLGMCESCQMHWQLSFLLPTATESTIANLISLKACSVVCVCFMCFS